MVVAEPAIAEHLAVGACGPDEREELILDAGGDAGVEREILGRLPVRGRERLCLLRVRSRPECAECHLGGGRLAHGGAVAYHHSPGVGSGTPMPWALDEAVRRLAADHARALDEA
jgi:hypothetical protein